MRQITFVTGNQGKWLIARDIFKKYGVELYQEKIDTPEIQSLDVCEVSVYSAKHAGDKLRKAVIKSDVGYYFEMLGGFPGPFVKYINQTLKPADILKMMEGKENRKVVLKECLTYYELGREPVTFISEELGYISDIPMGEGSTMDQILILEGYDKPKGMYSNEEMHRHFMSNLEIYHDVAKYIAVTVDVQ
ncbi:MAG TPA: non-canonical purine NTP pyrophosphatase [Clostridiales bacterium]|nr:non-canonical purine NTP pyrophosphatase [Clostridiales bacterium]